MTNFKRELLSKGINPNNLQDSVLKNAMEYGYNIVSNHFMAYTDKTKTWYIDQWL